ncbi:unnamed protein product [Lactuca virosa]|uniref:Uncharacterized protein n=1 Tax=Lactuca virosa TaxID=75947 RepID=A0AAU9MIS2_9ASTR|nr:unnamed protein product [Lactuca virosa]
MGDNECGKHRNVHGVSRVQHGSLASKVIMNFKKDLEGKNGNKALENFHYAHSSGSVFEKVLDTSPVVSISKFPAAPVKPYVPAAIPFTDVVHHPLECPTTAPAAHLLSSTSDVKFPVQVPMVPVVATCTKSVSDVVPIGFSGGYARMSGFEVSHDSLSHPPGFPNRFYGGNDLNLECSFNRNFMLEETNRTMETGYKIGFYMDGCFDHVQIIIEGERNKKIKA